MMANASTAAALPLNSSGGTGPCAAMLPSCSKTRPWPSSQSTAIEIACLNLRCFAFCSSASSSSADC
jgi:hypothetical protein